MKVFGPARRLDCHTGRKQQLGIIQRRSGTSLFASPEDTRSAPAHASKRRVAGVGAVPALCEREDARSHLPRGCECCAAGSASPCSGVGCCWVSAR